MITFGKYNWQELVVTDDKLLLITADIIELHWYHDQFTAVTWKDAAIRKYLNTAFYNTFTEAEKQQIIQVKNTNPDNPWFNVPGGEDTYDHIFLLSIEEVAQYFGNSSLNKGKWAIDDSNNHLRQAKYGDAFHWWRLRSPGYYNKTAASVNAYGHLYIRGNGVYGKPRDGGGLRPALWLRSVCV